MQLSMEPNNAWHNLWTPLSQFCGWVVSLDAADQVRKAYEVENSITFVSGKKDTMFGNTSSKIDITKNRIRFNDVGDQILVPYDGTPFIILAKCQRHCLFGTDKHQKKKERKQKERIQSLEEGHTIVRKGRKMLQSSRKKGCPAKIFMKHVVLFPDYKIKQNTEKRKTTSSVILREDFTGGNVRMEHRIYISLPKNEDHHKHILGQVAGFMNPLSKEVRNKLSDLVGQGVSSVYEMRQHLRVYVDSVLFAEKLHPALTDAAYYPSDETIRKHILAQLKLRNVKDNDVACETVGQSYNANVPSSLSNRPSSFINHNLEKIELGHSIEEHEIQHVKDNIYETFTDLSMDEDEVLRNSSQQAEEMELVPSETQCLEFPCAKQGPKSVKALAIGCREKLSLINNATYLCQKGNALAKLSSMLDEAVGFINENIYFEDGLVPESKPTKSSGIKRKRTSKVPVKENDTIQLVKKGKKSPSSKRSKTHETTSTVENINGDVIIEGHADIPETITKETTGTVIWMTGRLESFET